MQKHQLWVLFFFLILSVQGLAYYELPAMDTLIGESDIICIGTVSSKSEIERRGNTIFIKALVVPERVLKGPANFRKTIEVVSVETWKKDSGPMEDSLLPFPGKNSRVLIFLQGKEEPFAPVCARTAVFTIFGKKRLSPRALFTISELEKALGSQKDILLQLKEN